MTLHSNLIRFRQLIRLMAGWLLISSATAALNVQTFFIPFPEADFQTSLKAIDITGTPVGNSMKTIISIVVPTAGTVIRYDHWEDGYEADLNAPTQSGTQIWGDGNTSNGTAPGYATDILPAGAVITLDNNVALPRSPSAVAYDGRDRVGSTAGIAITRAGWGIAPGTVLASATEVYDTRKYGTAFKMPVGTATGAAQNFEYSALHIIASRDNTTVQVDVDGNGTVDQTKVLNMGDAMYVNGSVKAGATVASNYPVQVHELTGDIGSTYESRTFAIRPTSLWGSSYYAPVGTTLSTEVHTVFFYNPGASAITVTYETKIGTGTLSVPANGNSQFAMPLNSGAHFFTAGSEAFYAVGANDSGAAATSNQTHDWGYALVPENYLTTGLVIGFGPGSDDLVTPTVPDQNGNPVWVTPNASTTVYVNYSGDFTVGLLTAPNGAKYDTAYPVAKLASQTIYDPNDKNMTKARIFTTNSAKLAGAWGEDPSKAGPGAPYLDMGTTIVPFPQPSVTKTSAIVVDLNSDGRAGTGDTIEYTVRVANEGVVDLDNTIVLDVLPSSITYVPGSTKVNAVLVTDNSVPATIFPVDESGYTLYSIPPGSYSDVKYRATVNAGAVSIVNHVTVTGGSIITSLSASTTVPVASGGGNAPTTITFTDSVGTATSSYPQNGNVYVKVTNVDLNTNFAVVETISVTVTNPTTGDQELITLTETGPSTGIFLNTIALPSSISGGLTQQDNTLYALQGNGLVATFVNTLFGGTFTANAVIETSTLTKKLYLTDTLALDRVNPAVTPVDSTTAQSSPLGSGSSTIAVDAISTNKATGSNSITLTHVTGLGTNRIMLVSISKEDDIGNSAYAATGVTYGSQSLSKVIEKNQGEAECEIWMLLNPASGSNDVTVDFTGAESIDSAVVGVATFSGVNQTTPLRTNGSNSAKSTNASITIASALNDVVFDVLALDDARAATITAGQTSAWSLIEGSAASDGVRAAASTKPGASSVTSGWTVGSDDWVMCAVSIQPATASSTVSFTQTPTFATAFTMPTGSAPSASVYYTVATGSMPASPAITAVLKNGATTIATSSSASASGGLLSFTFPALSSAANLAIGDAVTLQITNSQSGVTFTVDYDSTTKPSVVNLPTNTVIVINSFGLYDSPYPGGTLVTSMINGQRVYARVTASDPFGAYDITGLDLAITDPSNATNTVNLTSTVASTASSKSYEYSWLAGPNDGGYTIQATAKEGSEGITAASALPLQVTSLDLGTPSTTTFTDSSGNTVPSYTTSGPVYVQVVDRDQNTNSAAAETVTVVVTTSNGDRETITLTETGINTGIFRSAAITTNTSTVSQGNSALNVVAGITLAAVYIDPTDPADTSSASALIPSASTTAVSVYKTLVSSSTVLSGGTVTYNITVSNTGTTNLPTVSLSDTFPSANLEFVNATTTPTSTGTGTLGWTNVGPLSSGQSVNVTVNFKALAAGATVTNSASVGGTATAGPSTVNVAVQKPAVTVTKTLLTPASGPVYIGDSVTWRIVVLNSGSTSITTLPLSDTFSGGAFTFVSATTTPDAAGSGSLLWNNLGPLAAAASKTIDVTMTVKGTGNPSSNTADVSYAVDASGNSLTPVSSTAGIQTIGGSIGSTIFKDINNNGAFSTGEGITNVYVYIDTDSDGVRDVGEPFGLTDSSGTYLINNLPVASGAGTVYDVKVDTTTLPTGLTTNVADPDATKNSATAITLTRTVTDVSTANWGYRGTASIGDYIWLDMNGNGTQDATDQELSGVKVFVDLNLNGAFDSNEPTATTNASGAYTIGTLPDGTYSVVIDTSTLPAGVTPTYDLDGTSTASKSMVVVTAGQVRTDVDFGYKGAASIGSTIYADWNGNGVKDGSDAGIANITVFIDLNGDGSRQANEHFATTDANGIYNIGGLLAGTYAVVVDATTLPAGVVVKGDPDSTKNGKTPVTLTASQANTTTDFGYQGTASMSGKFVVGNGNGVADTGEPGLNNVTITLTYAGADGAFGTSDDTTQTTTTSATGAYGFSNQLGGSYRISKTTPAGYASLADADGGNLDQISVTLAGGVALTAQDFEARSVTITGKVWDDANNSANNTFSNIPSAGESGTNAGGLAYAILVDSLGKVSQSAELNADGTYTFSVVPPASGYTIRLATSAETIGAAAPAASLPTGWVATSPTATVAFAVTTINLMGYDFGVEQPPTANTITAAPQPNPPGTTKVTVSTLTGTDPEDITVTSFIIKTLPANGTLYYNGSAVTADQIISGYDSTKLTVDPVDGSITVSFTYTAVDAGGKESTVASVSMPFIALTISGNIYNDANGLLGTPVNTVDGIAYAGATLYANLVSGTTVSQVVTITAGAYSFGMVVPNSSYTVVISTTQGTVGGTAPAAALPSGYVNTGENIGSGTGSDGSPNGSLTVTVTTASVANANFGVREQGIVAGHLYIDTNGNATQDPGELDLADVDVLITDILGNPHTATTDASGNWSVSVPPGVSVADIDETDPQYPTGFTQTQGNDPTSVTAVAGVSTNGGIDGFWKPSRIGNQVWEDDNHDGLLNNGETGINGVLVRLDSDLNNDGDFADAGETGFATTPTSGNGNYTFVNLPPGNYQVVIPTPPSGSPGATRVVNTGDDQIDNDNNGSQPVFGGPVSSSVIAIAPGENDSTIDFGFACHGTWEEWKFINPLGGQNGSAANPDSDGHDNLAEFAFHQPAASGAGDLYSIRPSMTSLGTLEAVFTRPEAATENVTYYLQYAAKLGSPTTWTTLAIIPAMITVVDNGDCTETVTINDLETLTGLNTGTGFVRIRAGLDEAPPSGTDHISYTEVEGWKETGLELCCRTYNIPFLRETAFTGTVDTTNGVSGQVLSFITSAGSVDLGALLTPGAYYLEVTSGDNEGYRFDIVSASGSTVTLASDANLQAATAPFNTLLGAPPASLAGDQVVIRRHWTLNDVFPPSGFGATNDRTTADQVQVFSDGQWIIYWLYDDGVLPARWVKTGDSSYADQGTAVLAPGQGLFFNNRRGAISLLAYGEVRENDFIRPLATGSNLVGGGYPLDQSAASRAMIDGFFGSRDLATADSFFVWKGDETIGVNGYNTYFLNNNAPRLPSVIKWVQVGDAGLLSRSADALLLGNRSVFIRSKDGLDAYVTPSPWTP